MNLQNITLVSFGYFEKDFLEKTAESVKHEFDCQVNIKEGHIDLSEFYDSARRQYNGNALLKQVDSLSFPDSLKTLGLFNVDLFIPILTFIFGQAFLGGRTGIASLYRFSNERYGIIGDERFLLDRFKKEVIHELGHTFGLIHCHTPICVMRSSTYVEDIDQKDEHFCLSCRARLM
ncbi:MAG: archaemetzincin family Zn-dependent metalloprotease [Bacteroidota bacterium]